MNRSKALLLAGVLAAGTVVAGAGTGAAAADPCAGSGPLPYTCAQPGDLIDVTLGELHPTQAVLGFDQVFYKLGRYGSDRDEAAGIVNDMLARAKALPQLQRHDHWDWHLHAVDPDRPLGERVVVETAMAMVDVIRADEMSRLDTCAADDCDDVVLDLSRNRSRRYCSDRCSSRANVAAYRARRRGVGAGVGV